jgi:hypothetical protein
VGPLEGLAGCLQCVAFWWEIDGEEVAMGGLRRLKSSGFGGRW